MRPASVVSPNGSAANLLAIKRRQPRGSNMRDASVSQSQSLGGSDSFDNKSSLQNNNSPALKPIAPLSSIGPADEGKSELGESQRIMAFSHSSDTIGNALSTPTLSLRNGDHFPLSRGTEEEDDDGVVTGTTNVLQRIKIDEEQDDAPRKSEGNRATHTDGEGSGYSNPLLSARGRGPGTSLTSLTSPSVPPTAPQRSPRSGTDGSCSHGPLGAWSSRRGPTESSGPSHSTGDDEEVEGARPGSGQGGQGRRSKHDKHALGYVGIYSDPLEEDGVDGVAGSHDWGESGTYSDYDAEGDSDDSSAHSDAEAALMQQLACDSHGSLLEESREDWASYLHTATEDLTESEREGIAAEPATVAGNEEAAALGEGGGDREGRVVGAAARPKSERRKSASGKSGRRRRSTTRSKSKRSTAPGTNPDLDDLVRQPGAQAEAEAQAGAGDDVEVEVEFDVEVEWDCGIAPAEVTSAAAAACTEGPASATAASTGDGSGTGLSSGLPGAAAGRRVRSHRDALNFGSIYEGSVVDAEQTFLEAALRNDPETMQPLLAAHPTLLRCCNEEGQNALHLACRAGAVAVVMWLAPFFAVDPTSGPASLDSPKQSQHEHARMIGGLNATDHFGRSCLHLCREANSVQHICSAGGLSKSTLRTGSIAGRALRRRSVLLDANAPDPEGATPLLEHTMAGRADCVRALLRYSDADPRICERSRRRRTCLHVAADRGSQELVLALLQECGAEVARELCGMRDGDGNTALHLAVSCQPSQQGQGRGQGALSRKGDGAAAGCGAYIGVQEAAEGAGAAEEGEDGSADLLKVIMTLLNAGSDPNARNARGVTALHFLCANPTLSSQRLHEVALPMMEVLFALGAQCNATDNDGCTPLLVACAYRQWTLCEALLRKGADMNIPCSVHSPFLRADALKHARRAVQAVRQQGQGKWSDGAGDEDEDDSGTDPGTDASGYTSLRAKAQQEGMHHKGAYSSGKGSGGQQAGVGSSSHDDFCTASDLLPKTPRERLFRCISAPQTRIPGDTRDRCMHCAGFFAGMEAANFYSKLGLVSGRHHCRLCNRVVCIDCAPRELPRGHMPDFVAASHTQAKMRVCCICYSILTDPESPGGV